MPGKGDACPSIEVYFFKAQINCPTKKSIATSKLNHLTAARLSRLQDLSRYNRTDQHDNVLRFTGSCSSMTRLSRTLAYY